MVFDEEAPRPISAGSGEGDRLEGVPEHWIRDLYDELRAIADRVMRGDEPGQTLQATALVHEALLKLNRGQGNWENEEHFLGTAAKAMRHVLVDHARQRSLRGELEVAQETPDELLIDYESRSLGLLDLDVALDKLATFDPQMARAVELRFFAGLDVETTARQMNISKRTLERRWAVTRAWLYAELS